MNQVVFNLLWSLFGGDGLINDQDHSNRLSPTDSHTHGQDETIAFWFWQRLQVLRYFDQLLNGLGKDKSGIKDWH